MPIGTTSNMEWLSGPGGSGSVEYTAGHGIIIDNYDHIISTDQSVVQDKLIAGDNITITNNVISAADQVQSDWAEADTSSPAYIANKPTIPTKTSDLTNDSNFITAADVPSAQVQSDWNETDSSDPAYIVNKPTIPSGNQLLPAATSADEDKVLTVDSNGDPAWQTPTASTQQQADWNQTNIQAVDYIKNKPQNLVQDASYVHTDNNFTNTEKNKLAGIAAGAEVNVQSDWNVTDSSSDAFIRNKPTIVNPVQSDWNQTNSSALDYIKNKPSVLGQGKDLVAGTNVTLQQTSDSVIISAQYAGATYNTQQISGSGHIMVSSTAQISTDLTDSGEIAAYFRCQGSQVGGNGWPGPSSNVDSQGAQFAMNSLIETTDFIDYTGGVFTENHFKNLLQYGYLDTYSDYMYTIDFNSDGLIVPYIGVNSDVMVFELAQEQTSSSDRILKQVGFSTTEAPISLMCDVIGGKRVKLNMYGVSATQTPSHGLHSLECYPCLSIVVRRI